MELVRAPWIRPAVVLHHPQTNVDDLLADFACDIRSRGFRVSGLVQLNNRYLEAPGTSCADEIELFDLGTGDSVSVGRNGDLSSAFLNVVHECLRSALRDNADLVVISRFGALEKAAHRLRTAVEDGIAQGMPVLTSIAGRCVDKWHAFAGNRGTLLPPEAEALWQWWGAERLYRDLALDVADESVRRIVCGPRWLMIEGQHGVGLAHLPKGPAPLIPRLPALRGTSLRALAQFTQSWDALEMAVGIAAINAHCNRYDLDITYGNGASVFRTIPGRVTVIGAFPGVGEIVPGAQVIEAQPRPGELPTIAMDTVLPGSAAVVVSSSAIINRTLPRILKLAYGSRVALIGPSTPMSPRLHSYGIEILGGFRARDVNGLAEAVGAGGQPRDFDRFGDYVHIRPRNKPTLRLVTPAGASPTPLLQQHRRGGSLAAPQATSQGTCMAR